MKLSPRLVLLVVVCGLALGLIAVKLVPLAIDAVVGESKSTTAHTYQECLAKSYGDAPCFVIDDGVTVQRS